METVEVVNVITRILGSLPAAALTALIAAFVAWRTIINATRRDIDNHKREKLEFVFREVRKARIGHWQMVPRLTENIQESTGTKFRPPNLDERRVAQEMLESVNFEESKIVAELWLPELVEVIDELERQTKKVLDVLSGKTADAESLIGQLTNIVSGGDSISAADAAEKACKEIAHLISPNSAVQQKIIRSQIKHIKQHM